MSAIQRWRLHRGGVVNIWQYREQTFDFSGGRAIFQGTNGSGKSRTLELLLPLCLDGDLRHLGSKGANTVSIRRLMLDDYEGGPNRIGYAWIELHRAGTDGDEYLTCGIGVKASATSQQISDSWRFVTPSRIGIDVHLATPDRVPLGPAALRDEVGADRMFDEQAFRAKVAETVYGVPGGRYGDLLHLQRTLRNPDIGLKVQDGQLEQILSDALPPLDFGVIEQLATSFEDLESIRENISRLSSADTAMRAFLDGYSGYALGALHSVGARADAARSTVDSAHAEITRLTGKLTSDTGKLDKADAHVRQLEERDDELEATIDSLKSLPAYQGLNDLRERERLVEAARDAATSALDTASTQRNHTDRAVETVLTVLRRLGGDLADAGELAESTSDGLATAGLDGSLCPEIPVAPQAVPRSSADRVRAKPDPEAEPLEVQRRMPPELAPDDLAEAIAEAGTRAGEAARVAGERATLALSLHERSRKLEADTQRLDGLRGKARDAQLAATEGAGRRNEARQRLEVAADVWHERAVRWVAGGPFTDGARPPQPPTVADVLASPDATRTARDEARRWATPHLTSLRQSSLGARQSLDELLGRIKETEASLIELRGGGTHAVPTRPAFASAPRDSASGAPFYRLVDFTGKVTAEQRAGLEAACESSGLLNAWVNADGSVPDPVLADILAGVPDGSASGRPLSEVLKPAVEPGSPVPVEVVDRLLRNVFLDDGPGLVLRADGSWRAGVLHGAMTKADAEYLGAGAREAARKRAVDELASALEGLRTEQERAERALATHTATVQEWEAHLEAFPDDRELIGARVAADNAVTLAEESLGRAERLRAEHEAAQGRLAAMRTELTQDSAAAGLTEDSDTLQRANRAAATARASAERLRDALGKRCAGTVSDLVDALHDHNAAVDDREAAERVADDKCLAYQRESAGLAELSTSIGGQAEELAERLKSMERERRAAREELPAARRAATELSNQVVKSQTLLDTRSGEMGDKQASAEAATRAFGAALAAPGVWEAAVPDERPAEPDEAFELLKTGVAEGKKLPKEEAVLTKLAALQSSLAGTHNVLPERHAGLLTVTVSAEDGPAPVAVAGRRVAEALDERRGFLSEQYQGIFALHLVRELADRLAGQIAVAEDLCRRMNDVLDSARSSQGVHVQLEWRPGAWLDDSTVEALKLIRMPFSERNEKQDARLQQVFTELIEAERDSANSGYTEILARALDYRSWFAFTVRVRDHGPDGKPRSRRLRQLSSGETRLISYVTLFAAAAAFYGAISADGESSPLRLVLLDEAFERLDDPTIARMLSLLVDLDMDWVITWPSGWGVSEHIPRMHIYDVLRPKSGRGVACTHTTWDGAALDRDDP
ncbi:uncharacterized protein (TIGR02680 family) [Herbihabitans rhizosphaerae]|uniref:Nuclease SbcCD subunit C n=1 Tax=Herbihabitans rhizosphaerae TaxID=1872711 RepID=A0A4Q7L4P7_9PSEU|nr:TIGR02680 family protein [Herbihabitans rhizosphaerae]RZS44176.1 uncharacterized protein (TIGR02680 family) [Herbihabitans rhizosphaerae]